MTTAERIAKAEQQAVTIEHIVSEMDSILVEGGKGLDKLAKKAIRAARHIERLLSPS
jgi:precorrin-6B methylase 2